MQNIYFIIFKKNYRQYFFQNATNTIILTNFANYPTTICEYPEYYEKNYEMLYKKECRKNNSESTWAPLLQLSLLVQKTYKSINYFCSIIQKKNNFVALI